MKSGLELSGIRYRYKSGSKDVLRGLSCKFESGSVNAVFGPSGSGKTTLLSLMAGLDHPTEGEILIGGEPYSSLDLDRLRREKLAMVFQSFNLLPVMTAIENVCYPMEMLGTPKAEAVARAKELLLSVGIGEELHKRYPSRLSGGEQQRVALARALSSGAGVILADEPTGNLDDENAKNVMDILLGLAHEKDYCIIIVSHSDLVANASDNVYRFKDGALVLA
jgi:putative ABC transport system ATP-binding protein